MGILLNFELLLPDSVPEEVDPVVWVERPVLLLAWWW